MRYSPLTFGDYNLGSTVVIPDNTLIPKVLKEGDYLYKQKYLHLCFFHTPRRIFKMIYFMLHIHLLFKFIVYIHLILIFLLFLVLNTRFILPKIWFLVNILQHLERIKCILIHSYGTEFWRLFSDGLTTKT